MIVLSLAVMYASFPLYSKSNKNQFKRVFTCRILVRTSFTSTRTLLTLPRISERLHEPGELSISSASMKSRLQIRIIKSYNIEIYSFVQNSLWTCAICWKRARIIRSGEAADTILASNLQATYFWHQYKKQSCSAMRLQIKSKISAENQYVAIELLIQ